MIKKFITIILMLILVLGAGYFESHYIASSFDELVGKLNQIKTELSLTPDSIDKPEYIGKLVEIHDDWQNHTEILKFFVWHTKSLS